MVLSDCKVEELYLTLYKIDVFNHGYKYAIQSLLTIEDIEKELKAVSVVDNVTQFKLDNLQFNLKLKKDFFKLVLVHRRQELDILATLIIAFIVMIYSFYKFGGLFN